MDYDYAYIYDIINVTSNETQFDDDTSPIHVMVEVLQFLMCCIGTATDILMIYIILRYKNMKKPINIYIMNWLICDALFMLAEPVEYRLFMLLEGLNARKEFICVMSAAMLIIRTLDLLFMLVLMFQWFFDKTKVLVFERIPYRIITGVWMFGLLEFVLVAVNCFTRNAHNFKYIEYKILASLFIIFILCFANIHFMRRCANPFSSTSSLPVALLSGFVICWMVIIISSIIYIFDPDEVLQPIYYFGQFCINLYPLLMFYLFYKIDPQFATCARILFKCSRSEEIASAITFDVISVSEEVIT